FFFFFSSRRRHTIFSRDWSSDVCSSDLECLYLISPHNLNVRPLVISDKDILTVEIESRSSTFLLSCDSRTVDLESSVKLTIAKADFQINLIRLKHENYFSTLRQKLLWGLDTRNY